MPSEVSGELTPADMEAVARPFAEPCARKLREWVESDHGTAMVNRLDLKRVMQEYDAMRSAVKTLREHCDFVEENSLPEYDDAINIRAIRQILNGDTT